ncbi:MAG: bifunctional tRNA (5-methylaminomethyl-2-thiouridine)(34)-methyltransferase MnmD/FAD-dependent, partial [Pseudomonadota bacterium]
QVIAEDLPGKPPDPGHWIHYARGGWVDPGALVRWWLATPGVTWRGRCDVALLRRVQPGPEDLATGWELLDAQGSVLAQAPVVVLALGSGLGSWPGLEQPSRPPPWKGKPLWPITPVRGQVTWFDADDAIAWPVSGQGYAVRLPTGKMLCGATSAPEDPDIAVRETDHAHNLERLRALTGLAPPLGAALGGRVGWRAVTPDRLPLIGAVPRLAGASPTEQTRFVPREPGLFVVGGYGSRGLTWAALGGEILTAWLEGTPAPLEGDLLDAVDPARFAVRAWRRAARDAP